MAKQNKTKQKEGLQSNKRSWVSGILETGLEINLKRLCSNTLHNFHLEWCCTSKID